MAVVARPVEDAPRWRGALMRLWTALAVTLVAGPAAAIDVDLTRYTAAEPARSAWV